MLELQKINVKREYEGAIRQGYSLTYLPPLDCLAVFGGCRDNELYLFSLKTKMWQLQATTGKRPTARKHHAAVYTETLNGLMIHGGEQNSRSLDQFHVLLLGEWKWKRLFLLKYPSARQFHSLLSLGPQVIIFGGISMPYNKELNDIWSLRKLDLIGVSSKDENFDCQCSPIDTKGQLPFGGADQLTLLYNSKLYVLTICQQTMEIFSLCLKKKTWRKKQVKNKLPKQLWIMGGCFQDHGEAVVFCRDQQKDYMVSFSVADMKLKVISGHKVHEQKALPRLAQVNSQTVIFMTWRKDNRSPILEKCTLGAPVEESATVQDYLIAIKNEQILSQELQQKNSCLQQLYKQMQSYITLLHQEYIKEEESDQVVQHERERHIAHCIELKKQYRSIDQSYNLTSQEIKMLRGELGNICQDFERCLETEFDDEA